MRYQDLFENAPLTPAETKNLLGSVQRNSFTAASEIEGLIARGVAIPTEIAYALVSDYGPHIRLFPDAPPPVRLAAVENNGEALKFLKNPSEAEQIAAVRSAPAMAKLIPDPSLKVQWAVIDNGPHLVRYINNPDIQVQRAVIYNNPEDFEFIGNPDPGVTIEAIQEIGFRALKLAFEKGVNLTPEMIRASIQRDPIKTVEAVTSLEPEHQRLAFEVNPKVYPYLKRLANFDPAIETLWHRHAHEIDRKANLPHIGQRRPGSMDGMNPDQIALLRWMDLRGVDRISVRDLKKLPFGNNPYFASLVRSVGGRDITKADLTSKSETIGAGTRDLMSKASISVSDWTGPQRIFDDRPNRTAVWAVDGTELQRFVTDEESQQKLHAYAGQSQHPTAVRKTNRNPSTSPFAGSLLRLDPSPEVMSQPIKPGQPIALGWVRFTVFGTDIWIDEVQSDLGRVFDAAATTEIKDLQDGLLIDFIRRMRRRGAQRFFMPSYDMKRDRDLYDANPPASVYQDLPKKVRFRKTEVTGIDPKVDGQTAWLLEGSRK